MTGNVIVSLGIIKDQEDHNDSPENGYSTISAVLINVFQPLAAQDPTDNITMSVWNHSINSDISLTRGETDNLLFATGFTSEKTADLYALKVGVEGKYVWMGRRRYPT